MPFSDSIPESEIAEIPAGGVAFVVQLLKHSNEAFEIITNHQYWHPGKRLRTLHSESDADVLADLKDAFVSAGGPAAMLHAANECADLSQLSNAWEAIRTCYAAQCVRVCGVCVLHFECRPSLFDEQALKKAVLFLVQGEPVKALLPDEQSTDFTVLPLAKLVDAAVAFCEYCPEDHW